MLEHAGKQVRSATHELLFVELQLDPGSTHETDPVLRDHTGKVASAPEACNPSDLFLQMRGVGKIVEAQNLLQRFLALTYQGKIIQGKLRNQSPLDPLSGRRANRSSWFSQSHNSLNRGDSLDFEVAPLASERQAGWEVPIRARASHRHGVHVRTRRPAGQIH